MATSYTNSDALGYYQATTPHLGGGRSDIGINPLEPIISAPIGPVVVQHVTPSCGEGAATIEATSTTALRFKAPGDTWGAAVTVAANTSALLESGTATKAARVYRDSVYSADDLGGTMTLDLVAPMNGAIGMDNATQTASNHYAVIYLHNHSSEDITSISITTASPILVALEAPSGGTVQTIADDTTAPTGLSWATSAAVATLEPGESRALWIHRTIGAATAVNDEATTTITCAYTYSGTNYSDPLVGNYRIGDATLARYEIHAATGADPNFATAAATSASLPFTYALSTSNTHHYAVRRRNQFNLESFNTLCEVREIGAGGADETDAITDPTVDSFTAQPGGECDLVLTYPGAEDATPADTWRLYITTDGTTPDPATDTPADTSMQIIGLAHSSLTNRVTIGPYDYDTVVKVIARAYSSDLADESTGSTVSTLTVDTQDPIAANWMGVTGGTHKRVKRPTLDKATYYNDPTNTVGLRTQAGDTELFGTSTALRGRLGSGADLWTGIDFANVAHSASGTNTPIEVVSGTEFYINVNGTRRAKVDLSGGTIEAATFVFSEVAIDLPVIGPTHTTSTATYIQIFHGVTGRWTPIIKVDSSGVFTATRAITQE